MEGDRNVVASKLSILKILSTPGVELIGLNNPYKSGLYKTGEIYLFVEIVKSVQIPISNPDGSITYILDSVINQNDQNGDMMYSSLATASPYCKYFNRSSALGTSTCMEVIIFNSLEDFKNFAHSVIIYTAEINQQGYSYTSGVFPQFTIVSDIPDLEDQMKALDNTWSTLTQAQKDAKAALPFYINYAAQFNGVTPDQVTTEMIQNLYDGFFPNFYAFMTGAFTSPDVLKFYNSLKDANA